MLVEKLVEIINKVCGLGMNWAKVCIYYCMATHNLKQIFWMPVLAIVARKGSGKSQLIHVLEKLCYKPYHITCHRKMSAVSLRNELVEAKDRTAIIEEGDLFSYRNQLEGYLINRVDQTGTSAVPVTGQIGTASGAIVWQTSTLNLFGATILHDRHEPNDMATGRRTIIVNVRHQRGKKFLKPDESLLDGLSLPSFSYGDIPEIFDASETTGSAVDAWEPLIRVADSLKDEEWINWAWTKVAEMSEDLADGQQYEIELVVIKAVLQAYGSNNGIPIVKGPLPLSEITNIIKKEYDPNIHPKTIATILRKDMGIKDIRNVGGVTKIYTSHDEIKKVADEFGYKDELL